MRGIVRDIVFIDELAWVLKEHYGLAKEDAEKKIKALEDANNASGTKAA